MWQPCTSSYKPSVHRKEKTQPKTQKDNTQKNNTTKNTKRTKKHTVDENTRIQHKHGIKTHSGLQPKTDRGKTSCKTLRGGVRPRPNR